MSLWNRIKSLFGIKAKPKALWLTAAENPLGIKVLDLAPVTQSMIAASTDPAEASMSVSWGNSTGEVFDNVRMDDGIQIDCDLALPCASHFPPGMLFAPSSMDEKWVIAYRSGQIVFAHSWTSRVQAIAQAEASDGVLRITSITYAKESVFDALKDVPGVAYWLLRTHALGELHPLVLEESTLTEFERHPTLAFRLFGNRIYCAARSYDYPAPTKTLRSDGELLNAIRGGDYKKARELVEAGEYVDTPCSHEGFTPLMVALVKGDIEMVKLLLELGADADARVDKGMYPLGVAIVHGNPIATLDLLLQSGATPEASNDDGFNCLHAAAETNRPEVAEWALKNGVLIGSRTLSDFTSLHVACGLGHVDAALLLVQAGADVNAASPAGTPIEVAEAEGHHALAQKLKTFKSR